MSKFIQMAIEQASEVNPMAVMYVLDDEGTMWKRRLSIEDRPFEEFYRSVEPKPTPSKKEKGDNPLAVRPEYVSEDTWKQFKAVRNKKRLPLTKNALQGIKEEGEKLGWSLEDTLQKCLKKTWAGFEAEWVQAEPVISKPACQRRVRKEGKAFMQPCGEPATEKYGETWCCQTCFDGLMEGKK